LNPYLLKYEHFYKITFLSSFLIIFFCKVERKSYLPYLIGVFYNVYFLILYIYGLVSVNACFFYFNSSFHFLKLDIKKCPFFIFRFENCKKMKKMSLHHNGLFYNFEFLKVLLNFLFFLCKKYLGEFLCIII
jgi:hypothetical protein